MTYKNIKVKSETAVSIYRLQNALASCRCPECGAAANNSITIWGADTGNAARIGFGCEHQPVTVKVKTPRGARKL